MLFSVMGTAVMMAISHVCEEVAENAERDIGLLSDIFDKADTGGINYDIFNDEPQNEQLA